MTKANRANTLGVLFVGGVVALLAYATAPNHEATVNYLKSEQYSKDTRDFAKAHGIPTHPTYWQVMQYERDREEADALERKQSADFLHRAEVEAKAEQLLLERQYGIRD